MYKPGTVKVEVDDETGPYALLPHRCNEWIIGGPQQIQDMIVDLQAALARIEGE